jgi:uncharacterized membrane protein YcaP (DUF421 family)
MLERLLELFAVNMPPWEIVVRGTAVYWSLFLVFRFLIRRDIGAVGVADLLVLVLVADAAQNAMAGGYETITEGLILVGTLIGWNMLFDSLAYRSQTFARFVQPPPLLLVRNGRILHRNLRREFVTVDDLLAKLRGHGVDDVKTVAKAYLESDGEVTVIRRRGRVDTPPATAKDRVA